MDEPTDITYAYLLRELKKAMNGLEIVRHILKKHLKHLPKECKQSYIAYYKVEQLKEMLHSEFCDSVSSSEK